MTAMNALSARASTSAPSATARPAPGATALTLPGVEQSPAYPLASAAALLRGLLRPHQLTTEGAGRYCASFQLSASLRQRWHAFFRTDATREIPYAFHTSAVALLSARVMADLGLNQRHVRLLRHVTQHVRDADPLGQVPQQQLECRLQRVTQLATGAVSVVLMTTISDPQGQLLATQEDHYAVRRLDTAVLPNLQRDRTAAAEFAQLRRQQPSLDWADANTGEWLLGADWGRQFGQLSGDLSPAHRSRWGARLLGLAAPTLPPACLRDLVMRQLADVGLRPERLELTLVRPVYLSQRIVIAQRDDRFEVTDLRGVLLACGRC